MTSSIGGSSPPPPEPSSGPGESAAEKAKMEKLLKEKVSNLGQLKGAMISALGEKDGTKLYNQFLTTFGVTMVTQLQQSADEANQATKKMGGQS